MGSSMQSGAHMGQPLESVMTTPRRCGGGQRRSHSRLKIGPNEETYSPLHSAPSLPTSLLQTPTPPQNLLVPCPTPTPPTPSHFSFLPHPPFPVCLSVCLSVCHTHSYRLTGRGTRWDKCGDCTHTHHAITPTSTPPQSTPTCTPAPPLPHPKTRAHANTYTRTNPIFLNTHTRARTHTHCTSCWEGQEIGSSIQSHVGQPFESGTTTPLRPGGGHTRSHSRLKISQK